MGVNKDHIYKVIRNGVTYFMNGIEYRHADEWIATVEAEIKESTERHNRIRAELYKKWEEEDANRH